MNWFRENRSVGLFLMVAATCFLGLCWFLWDAKHNWDETVTRFHDTSRELNRLEQIAPYPSSENLQRMRAHTEEYAMALARLKEELKAQAVTLQPLAPNEFQSRLRLTMNAVTDKARANRVRLPDRFYLGFDEFASALPTSLAAPFLGRELTQIEWLLATLCEARIDALTSFRRTPLREEHGPASPVSIPTTKRLATVTTASPQAIERSVIDATFVSTPGAARKVLNQIAGATDQFFVLRLLRVRNEKEKGPLREIPGDFTSAVTLSSIPATGGSRDGKPGTPTMLNFIVGNEHVEVTAKIEIVRFVF